ncbi:hypothetical protein ACQZM9_21855 [Streptomyces sp. P11-1]|uniref:hypothetical protein n=1 Tax=Streptomyces sp. P11-1 TaxID=3423221 RepID=UPI003D2EB76A
MARRTMALRKARAADRQKRRAELEHLLARLDRHTLLDTERPLLRARVEQLLATDADLRRTIAGQQTLVQRQARQLGAAHEAIREAEQDAAEWKKTAATYSGLHSSAEQDVADLREQLHAYRAVEAQRQAEPRPAAKHSGGNAEDCPACGPNPPYPFLCPGAPGTRADRVRAFLAEQTAHLPTPEPQS